jgi:Protein of unknown function (DUF3108)
MQSSQDGPLSEGPGEFVAFPAFWRRILFAFAFSFMLHAAILWLPHLRLPHEPVDLPPLTARLEPLHAPPAKEAAVKPDAKPATLTGTGGVARQQDVATAPVLSEMEKSTQAKPFPKHLQLIFNIYRGTDTSSAGVISHQLDVDRDNYSLKATRQVDGISELMNDEQLNQASYGKIDGQGLHPAFFEEERMGKDGRQKLEARFDWAANKLRLSQGVEIQLPAGTFDVLSFMYQFSQMEIPALRVEFFPMSLIDGVQLQQCQIEIGMVEDVATQMGLVRALHLRKIHSLGEAYFEIWLGTEYRMLPVKIRRVDGSGKVIEEFVISDIRADG